MNKIHNRNDNLYSIRSDSEELLIKCIEASLRCKTPLWVVPEGSTTILVRHCFNIVIERLSLQSLCSYTFFSGLIDQGSLIHILPKEVIQHIFGFATSYRPISFNVYEGKYFTSKVKQALLNAEYHCKLEKNIRDIENSKEFAEENLLSEEILAMDKACHLQKKKWSLKSILPRKRNF